MYNSFISQLSIRLQEPLPGEDAQHRMSPSSRRKLADIPLEEYKPRDSAVLILLFPEDESIKTVFIQRPIYKGVHSGQIAFPGGKHEETDNDLEETALRETYEEVGVNSKDVNIIGKLTQIYIDPSNFLVTPFLGYLNERPTFIPDEREVAEIIDYNIFDLNNENLISKKEVMIAETFPLMVPCYDINGKTLWGATAMMVSELNEIITGIKMK